MTWPPEVSRLVERLRSLQREQLRRRLTCNPRGAEELNVQIARLTREIEAAKSRAMAGQAG